MFEAEWDNKGNLVNKETGEVLHRAHPQCKRNVQCIKDQKAGKHDWYFKTLGK